MVLNQVDQWNGIRHAPQTVADKARAIRLCYNHDLRLSAQHWQEELNPEGIQRDLTRLFENPQEGANALRRRWLR